MVRLSKRLAAVACCVPMGARVADVGTDHGLIPVWLAQKNISRDIWATDLREGPLRGARELVEQTETEQFVHLRVCDGLDGFGAGDVDAVILSGLGGEHIIGILARAEWLKNDVRLILQPQSKVELLRQWLSENDFSVVSERLVLDANRLYPILCAEGGRGDVYTQAELYTGLLSRIGSDPLLPARLDSLCARMAKAAPYDKYAETLLAGLEAMKGRGEA